VTGGKRGSAAAFNVAFSDDQARQAEPSLKVPKSYIYLALRKKRLDAPPLIMAGVTAPRIEVEEPQEYGGGKAQPGESNPPKMGQS